MFIRVVEIYKNSMLLDGNFTQCLVSINGFTITHDITSYKECTILRFNEKIPEWIKPGDFLYGILEHYMLILSKCDQDKVTKTFNWKLHSYEIRYQGNLIRYKCTAYLTVLDHGDLSILVKENLNEFKEVLIGSIKSSEIISCEEGSIIYFKDKIDKIPKYFEMVTNEM